MNIGVTLFVFILTVTKSLSDSRRLEEYFKWKQLSFVDAPLQNADNILFPDIDAIRELDAGSALRDYIAYNNVPMGTSHYKDRLFITIPRRRPGVPSTLNYVSVNAAVGSSPSLRPYPDIHTNALHPLREPDEHRIISVYRTRVDEACKRLWFVDTGLLEYPNNNTQVQQPSLWIYNLENDKFISRFEFPPQILARGNGLASVTVDAMPDQCDNAFAYIPDLVNYRLYVYSFAQDRMWTFSHNFFSFDPLKGDFNVAGFQYQWNDGIFSLTLGKRYPDGYRTAYFHPMASTSEFTVSTQTLQDEQATTRSTQEQVFQLLGKRGEDSQSAMHQFDENSGVMFYSQVAINGIACWNSAKPFSVENHAVIAMDNTRMIYPADLSVDSDGVVWIMTNTMPRFIYGRIDPNEFNFRVWRANAFDLIKDTPCDGSHPKRGTTRN